MSNDTPRAALASNVIPYYLAEIEERHEGIGRPRECSMLNQEERIAIPSLVAQKATGTLEFVNLFVCHDANVEPPC